MKNKFFFHILLFSIIFYHRAAAQNQAGAFDTTFSHDGKVRISDFGQTTSFYSAINSIQVQNDGKIVTGGYEDYNFSIARYLPNGVLDSTFGNNGFVQTILTDSLGFLEGEINSISLQNDGKILATGTATRNVNSTFAITRYLSNGMADSSFGVNGQIIFPFNSGFTNPRSIKIQADGKIVVAGYAKPDSTLDYGVVRLNDNGSLDTTFGSTGKLILDIEGGIDKVCDMVILPNGKIILGGIVERILIQPNNSYFGLVQINSDGSLDSLFGTNGVNKSKSFLSINYKNCLGVNSQGKILATGGGLNEFQIIQFNSDGSIDYTFGNNGEVSYNPTYSFSQAIANVLLIQADDKILVGGNSLIMVGTNSMAFTIIRCNPDGSLDSSFDYDGKLSFPFYAAGIHDIQALSIQNDGKILAAGKVRNLLGNYCQGLCRLLGECQPGNFSNNQMICDGESILVGNNTYDSAGVYYDVLPGFSGCDSLLTTTLLVSSDVVFNQSIILAIGDTLFVGNNFYTSDGTYTDTLSTFAGCDSIVISNVSLVTNVKLTSSFVRNFEVHPNPFSNKIMVKGIEENGVLAVFNSEGNKMYDLKTSGKTMELDLGNLAAGFYFFKYIGENSTEILRMVKL
jgi:uncharacterized delta-60 repeat protein